MSNKDAWSDEEALAFWTARPIRYGLPIMIALMIITNILAMKAYLFDGELFDWGAASILFSMVLSAVLVSKKVERIRRAMKSK
ncbi:hypothetical protein [uncultured Psychrobacter sp.]|uniref:hypothetical protein n=1 Tax=uncultured Psychrobacter sp. TaxID=259303 RepID=UPI0030D736A0